MKQNRTAALVSLLLFAAVINYIDRGSLSVAAPALSLSPSHLGFLLSAFFWSYTLMQLLAGWLADRFPVFWVFGIGFFVWSAATIGSGFASGFISLSLLRFALGAGKVLPSRVTPK